VEAERVSLLCDYYYDASTPSGLDPFSAEYLDEMLRLHGVISGRDEYSPGKNELAPYLTDQRIDLVRAPPPFGTGGSDTIGDFFISWGSIMRVLALRHGRSVLEYGPGGGQLSIALARNGCDVTVVDIEATYIDGIRRQCTTHGIAIETHVGEFGDVPAPGKRYDAVLFFEAFHHSLRHNDLLRRLHDVVAEDGVIAIAGEPIIEAGGYWEPTVPFPWGPRCDLMSLWAMRTHGWMELGFREAYFYEALRRAGWKAEKHVCPLTARGNTYILRRHSGEPTVGPERNDERKAMGAMSSWRRMIGRFF
jgi:2-polyprenyl-3-methyl-5-hydroxy-6-metoxy-1,4-benzoquinol methylase